MNNEAVKTKFNGLGSKLLENVDPNPLNFVAAGIIHTQAMQIGTLIRLEPNTQANVCGLNSYLIDIDLIFADVSING